MTARSRLGWIPALAALLPPLDAELAALIRLIRATRAPQGPAA